LKLNSQVKVSYNVNRAHVIHRVSIKACRIFLRSVPVKYETISIQFGRTVPIRTFNETLHELATSPDIHTSTALENLKRQIATSTQSTCTFNEALNCRQICRKSHLYLYSIFSKCPPPVLTTIWDVDELEQRIKNEFECLNHTVIELTLESGTSVYTRTHLRWRRTFGAL